MILKDQETVKHLVIQQVDIWDQGIILEMMGMVINRQICMGIRIIAKKIHIF
jgi:hypothetical protein